MAYESLDREIAESTDDQHNQGLIALQSEALEALTQSKDTGSRGTLEPDGSLPVPDVWADKSEKQPEEILIAREERHKMAPSELIEKLEGATTTRERYDALKQYGQDHYNNPAFKTADGAAYYVQYDSTSGNLFVYELHDLKKTAGDDASGPRTFEGQVVSVEGFVFNRGQVQHAETTKAAEIRHMAEQMSGELPPKDGRPYTNAYTSLEFKTYGENGPRSSQAKLHNHWQLAPR